MESSPLHKFNAFSFSLWSAITFLCLASSSPQAIDRLPLGNSGVTDGFGRSSGGELGIGLQDGVGTGFAGIAVGNVIVRIPTGTRGRPVVKTGDQCLRLTRSRQHPRVSH